MRSVCPLALAVAAAFKLEAATYYVDSAQGQDANSGTSMDAPWKTLGRVNAIDLDPGDRVLFKSGSAWDGQLAPMTSGPRSKTTRATKECTQ